MTPHSWQGFKYLAIFCCLPRNTGRELGPNWNNWASNKGTKWDGRIASGGLPAVSCPSLYHFHANNQSTYIRISGRTQYKPFKKIIFSKKHFLVASQSSSVLARTLRGPLSVLPLSWTTDGERKRSWRLFSGISTGKPTHFLT